MLRAAAKGLLVVTGAAVCCGPTLLSTDAGLASAVRLINSLSQDVHLSIESVSLGWTRPIEIRGVSVAERSEGTTGQETGTRSVLRIPRISSSAPLRQLLTPGTGPTTLVAEDPVVDLSLHDSGDVRTVRALEKLHVLKRSPPRLRAPRAVGDDKGDDPSKSAYGWEAETAIYEAGAAPTVSMERVHEAPTGAPAWLQSGAGGVPFSGELVSTAGWPALRLLTTTGTLQVPETVAPALEPRVHVQVLMGAPAMEEEEEEGEQGVSKSPRWWERAPDAGCAGRPLFPLSLRLDAQSLHCSMRGWATARGYTLLAQPLRAEMRCHAALAERLLAGVNPLLAGAVRLEDRVQMRVALSPQAGLLPACSWHVRLEPVQVDVARGAALLRILEPLGRYTGALPARLHARLSAMEAIAEPGRELRAGRADVDLGADGRLVRLALWGQARAAGDGRGAPEAEAASLRLAWAVAVPGDTLRALGVCDDVGADRGLALLVRGTAAAPDPKLAAFAADLLQLYLLRAGATSALSTLTERVGAWMPGAAAPSLPADRQALVDALTVPLPPLARVAGSTP